MNAEPAAAPSSWVTRWSPLIPPGEVLDLACGRGRHALYLAAKGYRVLALDRDPNALASLGGVQNLTTLEADLEDGSPWPLAGRRFAGIFVTNYLHRPLFPRLADALSEGGVLLYETFMAGNERFGSPSNPKFLLRPGELLSSLGGLGDRLSILAFEQGRIDVPKKAMIQRLCALRGEHGEGLLQP